MSRRKPQPETFDVAEFLRETDDDLKSAIHTLIGREPAEPQVDPGPKLIPPRRFPIRQMEAPEDAHSRAEQQVYDTLWRHARPLDDGSRSITIGFGEMARLVRLSESNARINLRSLVAKLAIEESAGYDCERSLGRTYRIFSPEEILRRRRQAGLLWYMRRTLAVVFVDPVTGQPIDLGIKRPRPKRTKLAPGPNLLHDTLARYGPVDDTAIDRLRAATARICPDFTDDELVHFIRLKGEFILKRNDFVSSPIGFLLTAVPRCFEGPELAAYRQSRAREEDELRQWYKEQQAILENPNASEEDRKWAEKVLFRR